jgi:hypothetical protein
MKMSDEGKTAPLELENVTLIFKNFSGKKSQYNERGDRTFSILIENPGLASNLRGEGWNIKELKQEDEEAPVYFLSVKVNFDSSFPPRVYLIKRGGRVQLNENTISMLDYSQIKTADVKINPYHWVLRGDSGISAYLSVMYVEIESSKFDDKYDELPVL